MELVRGIISFIVYGICAKFSLKAVFSLLKFNFITAFFYGFITMAFLNWIADNYELWSLSQIIDVINNFDFNNLNILLNTNNIRFNIRNFPINF